MAISAGAMHFLKTVPALIDLSPHLAFRAFLTLFCSLNFLLLAGLMRQMQLGYAFAWALLVTLLPSTSAAGAIWGQVDDAMLTCCLGIAILVLACWRAHMRRLVTGASLLGVALLLPLLVLTKQLTLFSLPFVGMLALVTVLAGWRADPRAFPWLFAAGILACLLWFRFLDTFYPVPAHNFSSSYWYVWHSGASEHATRISGNGFNIWMFLGRDMWSSSNVPFATIAGIRLTPFGSGAVLYLAFMVGLTWSCASRLITIVSAGSKTNLSEAMALACFYHGLCWLGFNVLLTGTHERYLSTGYPFLVVGLVWFTINARAGVVLLAGTVLCAVSYGTFVLSVISDNPESLGIVRYHLFQAGTHLMLLIALVVAWIRLARPATGADVALSGSG